MTCDNKPLLLLLELSHLINGNYLKRASPRSTLSLAKAKKRRRRRRISITAGEESEANVTCGYHGNKKTSSKRANISKLCKDYICSPSSRTIFSLHVDRRLRCLRQLNQRLWIFAAFGDAFLFWQATK